MEKMNSYELSRNWFDYCFENPEMVRPTHTALYFFIIEHCNRLGWKAKFGLPMEMAKDAIGIKNYRTYTKTFEDLIKWGFIKLIQKSKNQYSSNIIAIVQNPKATTKATTKALDKAMIKHSQKQVHGIVCIDKHNNNKHKTKNKEQSVSLPFPSLDDVIKYFIANNYSKESAIKAFNFYEVANWIDTKGNIINNWKQKMISQWFKDENKIVEEIYYDKNGL